MDTVTEDDSQGIATAIAKAIQAVHAAQATGQQRIDFFAVARAAALKELHAVAMQAHLEAERIAKKA